MHGLREEREGHADGRQLLQRPRLRHAGHRLLRQRGALPEHCLLAAQAPLAAPRDQVGPPVPEQAHARGLPRRGREAGGAGVGARRRHEEGRPASGSGPQPRRRVGAVRRDAGVARAPGGPDHVPRDRRVQPDGHQGRLRAARAAGAHGAQAERRHGHDQAGHRVEPAGPRRGPDHGRRAGEVRAVHGEAHGLGGGKPAGAEPPHLQHGHPDPHRAQDLGRVRGDVRGGVPGQGAGARAPFLRGRPEELEQLRPGPVHEDRPLRLSFEGGRPRERPGLPAHDARGQDASLKAAGVARRAAVRGPQPPRAHDAHALREVLGVGIARARAARGRDDLPRPRGCRLDRRRQGRARGHPPRSAWLGAPRVR
mmetsp:Transcript_65728/g.174723  ORF Transcript_65728/g.174723 Transcript_65728/m.174723 type:complete len:367 (+) Transcript_65728:381-1481(+)